jgi:hypothetical protein
MGKREERNRRVCGGRRKNIGNKGEVWRIERNEPGAVADDIFVQDTVRQHPQAGVH